MGSLASKGETDSLFSEKLSQTGSQKQCKGFATWFSTFWEFCVQILKRYEDKPRRPLVTFVCMTLSYMPGL